MKKAFLIPIILVSCVVLLVATWFARPFILKLLINSNKQAQAEEYSQADLKLKALYLHTDNIEIKVSKDVFISYLTDNLDYEGEVFYKISDNEIMTQISVADLATQAGEKDSLIPYSQIGDVYVNSVISLDPSTHRLIVTSHTMGNGTFSQQIPAGYKNGYENEVNKLENIFGGTLLDFKVRSDGVSVFLAKSDFDVSNAYVIETNASSGVDTSGISPNSYYAISGGLGVRISEKMWAEVLSVMLKAGSAVQFKGVNSIVFLNVCDINIESLSNTAFVGDQSLTSLCRVKISTKYEAGNFIFDSVDFGNSWINQFTDFEFLDFISSTQNIVQTGFASVGRITKMEIRDNFLIVEVRY